LDQRAKTMNVETFYDFTFRARHSLEGRSEAAAHTHWHTYVVRLWFAGHPDQDSLSERIERDNRELHGANLNDLTTDSSDEGLASNFLKRFSGVGCVRVRVTSDGRRGAEARL
jgi:6-pyruvoyl-tetrahydropterin synthase